MCVGGLDREFRLLLISLLLPGLRSFGALAPVYHLMQRTKDVYMLYQVPEEDSGRRRDSGGASTRCRASAWTKGSAEEVVSWQRTK